MDITGFIHFLLVMYVIGYVLNLVVAYHYCEEVTAMDFLRALRSWDKLFWDGFDWLGNNWFIIERKLENLTVFEKKSKDE